MRSVKTQRLFKIVSGLWVGCFITVGFLVVPILFSTLGDRQIAGLVAAKLFQVTAYISVGASALLMLSANHLIRSGLEMYRPIRWLLLGMLACALGSAFILIPWMNSLRDQALYFGLSIYESSYATLFSRLHAISSIIFMAQALLGIALVWLVTKNAD